MSALALVLKNRGCSVSGSDQTKNHSILNLEKLGVKIFKSQKGSNLSNIEKIENKHLIVVISSAIPPDNDELQYAYKNNINIIHRSDLLNDLISQKNSILVAGSHGKTTTSTLITTIISHNNQDPTAIIGGIVPCFQSNAHAGKGKILVAEIDESDGSITKYNGDIGIITNIELDHTDYYPDMGSLIKAMNIFGSNCKSLILNYDCSNLKKYFSKKEIWWSIKEKNNIDFAAIPNSMNGNITIANYYEKGEFIDKIELPIPGVHNLSNALGAIAACRVMGLKYIEIKNSLSHLKSPNRRFEFKGVWNGRQIIDDYAHHPSEVRETISMARLIIKSKESFLPLKADRLVGVFQAHRYTRTRDLMKDFVKYLGKVDLLFLAPIYSAGEKPIPKINNKTIKSMVLNTYPNLEIIISENLINLEELIKEKTKKNDLILIMGAGDISKLSEKFNRLHSKKEVKSENYAA